MTASQPGRPRKLSREKIEQAIIEVGFDKASTTMIAKHLGVEQSSLYRHIGSRHEILLAAAHRVIVEHPWQLFPHDGWEDYLQKTAEELWKMLRSHPGMTEIFFQVAFPAPGQTSSLMVNSVATLRSYGFSSCSAMMILESVADLAAATVKKIECSPYEEDKLPDCLFQLAHSATQLVHQPLANTSEFQNAKRGNIPPFVEEKHWMKPKNPVASQDQKSLEQAVSELSAQIPQSRHQWFQKRLLLLMAGARHLLAQDLAAAEKNNS